MSGLYSDYSDFAHSKKDDALSTCLGGAPQLIKDKAAKDRNATAVLDVLISFKNDEIAPACAKLNSEQVDVLAKYVFRGMATLPPNEESKQDEYARLCEKLLIWHGAMTKNNNFGCIVRSLTDRKTV